jgi:hypothetical protein
VTTTIVAPDLIRGMALAAEKTKAQPRIKSGATVERE